MAFFRLKKTALPELNGKSKPYVMAHRGNQVLCPENTIAAFTQAIADGADILETDLHLTSDGVFVCIHDATLDRTTDGTGPVLEKTAGEIKKLSAANQFPDFSHERVPTLKEVLKIIPDDVALALELKTDAFLDKAVCRELAHILSENNMIDRAIVISFSFARIQTVKEVAPEIYSGWITLSRLSPRKGPDMLGPYWRIFLSNPFYVFKAHIQNQAVCPLDTAPDSRLWLYKLLCCDAVITDDPGKTVKKLKRK